LVKELGADVNQRDEKGYTALTAAVYAGQDHIVRYLVEEPGADVNSQANSGLTPLYMAALRGQLDMVRTLLNLGADIDRSNNVGITPLIIASRNKHPEIVKWLIKAGADTQTVLNNVNSTAASISRQAGASTEQTHYSNVCCSGAGVMKCTGCKQARYCGEACQLAHRKAHKADCRRWIKELAAGKGN
jgi:ankyrin repeat protein